MATTARRSRVIPLEHRHTRTIVTHVTEHQADTIRAAAGVLGITIAEFIRSSTSAAATKALSTAETVAP